MGEESLNINNLEQKTDQSSKFGMRWWVQKNGDIEYFCNKDRCFRIIEGEQCVKSAATCFRMWTQFDGMPHNTKKDSESKGLQWPSELDYLNTVRKWYGVIRDDIAIRVLSQNKQNNETLAFKLILPPGTKVKAGTHFWESHDVWEEYSFNINTGEDYRSPIGYTLTSDGSKGYGLLPRVLNYDFSPMLFATLDETDHNYAIDNNTDNTVPEPRELYANQANNLYKNGKRYLISDMNQGEYHWTFTPNLLKTYWYH